ncbi:MAG: hypothetical protein D6701_01915 [Gemmatimonadetes bacterium]|nr:MAG: hypothetical protein D6701_01915 [Gemmatimonadota bacterium]
MDAEEGDADGVFRVIKPPAFDKTGRFVRTLTAIILAGWAPGAAAQAPDEPWRTLRTEHFDVSFPAPLEAVARRAGAIAERAWIELRSALTEAPSGRVQLVVTDHIDASNGLASPLPYNRVMIQIRPPMEGYDLAFFDDWLELVLTHELTHVLHLDRTGPLGRLVRTLLGRIPSAWPAFPGLATTGWVREGLATYYESALTTSGRVRGTSFDMVLRVAALEGRLETVEEASGDSPEWPAGNRIYVYGSHLFDFLVEHYGPEAPGRFVEAYARQVVPYRLDAAGRAAFGASFSGAWRAWREAEAARARALVDSLAARAPITRPTPLVRHARWGLDPRIAPDGAWIAYVRQDGSSDTQLRLVRPDGGGDRRLARLTSLADIDWLPDGRVLVAQREFDGPYRVRNDLFVIDAAGRERRLTRRARLDQPSVGPDGRWAVAVQDSVGTNRLVRVDLTSGRLTPLTPARPDVHWAYPAVSPDGRWIAASRWTPGAFYDVVLLDADGREVTRVTRDRAIDQAPAWSPDGRWLVWASDRSGIANLHAVPVDPASGEIGARRQLTNVVGGLAHPHVAPDGSYVVVSSYHADGWDVERVPFRPEEGFEPFSLDPRFEATPAPTRVGTASPATLTGEVGPYRAWRTLLPRFWEPTYTQALERRGTRVLGAAVGARTEGRDVVGRHAWSASVGLRSDGRTDWAGAYGFFGLGNPTVVVSASQGHDADGPFRVALQDGGEAVVFLTERERRLRGSLTWTRQRARSALAVGVSAGHIWERLGLRDERLEPSPLRLSRPDRRLGELSLTLSGSTARQHAFAVGRDQGASGFVRLRGRRELALPDSLRGVRGRDRSFREVTGEVRAYLPLPVRTYTPLVLAGRLSGGAAAGSGADAFHFDVGGAAGEGVNVVGTTTVGGRALLFPVRGFVEGARFGRYAWSASAELRVPLASVHRGWGLVPIHLDRLVLTGFVDAGNAWGPDEPGGPDTFVNPRDRTLLSAGGEVVARFQLFWSTPLDGRIGLAAPLSVRGGASLYARIGVAF